MSEPDPRLPSINDPFNLKDCEQYPFPLTPEEDQILKHILRITASDDQMALRAYKSIVCMWARSEMSAGGANPPELLGLTPSFGEGVDDITVDLTGRYFDASSKVYFKGFPYTPTFTPGVIQTLRVVINLADLKRVGGLYPVTVVNQFGLISNAVNFQVNPHTPYQISVSPTSAQGGTQVTFTITGFHFNDDATVYLNGVPLNTPADLISRSRTQIVIKAWTPPFVSGAGAPSFFVASGSLQVMSNLEFITLTA